MPNQTRIFRKMTKLEINWGKKIKELIEKIKIGKTMARTC